MNRTFEQERYVDWREDPWDDVADAPGSVGDDELEQLPRHRRGWRWVLLVVGVIVAMAVIGAGITGVWVLHQITPPGPPGALVTISIDDGMTVSQVADRLEQRGVIGSALVFRWYARTRGGLNVKPGYYQVHLHDKMDKIITVLSTPPELTYVKVTFPEGLTLEQTAKRLEAAVPRLSAEKFLALARSGAVRSTLSPNVTNLEGLLFPDTYQVAANDDELAVLKRMVDLMDRVASKERVDLRSQPGATINPYQVLTIASMIEREARFPEDRPKIARVIINRLAAGMPLAIDATLLYNQPGNPTAITDAMKKADSPYNTYKVAGLPPTPIAGPSQASIHAAMNPADGPWLYYVVADAAGHHVFATTLEEHNANVAKARALKLVP